jgi:hypothetical protein
MLNFFIFVNAFLPIKISTIFHGFNYHANHLLRQKNLVFGIYFKYFLIKIIVQNLNFNLFRQLYFALNALDDNFIINFHYLFIIFCSIH